MPTGSVPMVAFEPTGSVPMVAFEPTGSDRSDPVGLSITYENVPF